jgi:hypothetical protein
MGGILIRDEGKKRGVFRLGVGAVAGGDALV